ncbi:hypothetical protein ABFA07_007681 [Porites harrisoni]
MTCWARKGKM